MQHYRYRHSPNFKESHLPTYFPQYVYFQPHFYIVYILTHIFHVMYVLNDIFHFLRCKHFQPHFCGVCNFLHTFSSFHSFSNTFFQIARFYIASLLFHYFPGCVKYHTHSPYLIFKHTCRLLNWKKDNKFKLQNTTKNRSLFDFSTAPFSLPTA